MKGEGHHAGEEKNRDPARRETSQMAPLRKGSLGEGAPVPARSALAKAPCFDPAFITRRPGAHGRARGTTLRRHAVQRNTEFLALSPRNSPSTAMKQCRRRRRPPCAGQARIPSSGRASLHRAPAPRMPFTDEMPADFSRGHQHIRRRPKELGAKAKPHVRPSKPGTTRQGNPEAPVRRQPSGHAPPTVSR